MIDYTRLRRRDLLKSGLAAVAGTATAGIGHGEAYASPAPETNIATRPFGKTGLKLPILGMGSSPLVAAWSRGYG